MVDIQETVLRDNTHARAVGIGTIYQELYVVENLSVAENIFLAKEPLGRLGLIDRARMRSGAREILKTIDLDLDPSTRVSELSVGQQQMIEIAKAISDQSQVIIMDEPTASLSHHETRTLMELIKKLRE